MGLVAPVALTSMTLKRPRLYSLCCGGEVGGEKGPTGLGTRVCVGGAIPAGARVHGLPGGAKLPGAGQHVWQRDADEEARGGGLQKGGGAAAPATRAGGDPGPRSASPPLLLPASVAAAAAWPAVSTPGTTPLARAQPMQDSGSSRGGTVGRTLPSVGAQAGLPMQREARWCGGGASWPHALSCTSNSCGLEAEGPEVAAGSERSTGELALWRRPLQMLRLATAVAAAVISRRSSVAHAPRNAEGGVGDEGEA